MPRYARDDDDQARLDYEDDYDFNSKPGLITGAAICWLIFAICCFGFFAMTAIAAAVVAGVGNPNEKELAIFVGIVAILYLFTFVGFLVISIQCFRGKSPNLILSIIVSFTLCFLFVASQVIGLFVQAMQMNPRNGPATGVVGLGCGLVLFLPCFLGGLFALIGRKSYMRWKERQ